jgi:hypothetical protein
MRHFQITGVPYFAFRDLGDDRAGDHFCYLTPDRVEEYFDRDRSVSRDQDNRRL